MKRRWNYTKLQGDWEQRFKLFNIIYSVYLFLSIIILQFVEQKEETMNTKTLKALLLLAQAKGVKLQTSKDLIDFAKAIIPKQERNAKWLRA